MDPINPWLDAEEVRQLAQSLLPPPKNRPPQTEDAGFNENFVGFTAAETTPSAASPVAVPSPTPAPAPTGSFHEQCLYFERQIQLEHQAEGLFILDLDGNTVYGAQHHAPFHFIARSLTTHAQRRGLPKGHIHLKVGPSRTLDIIPVSLPNGGWVAGTMVPAPLPAESIKRWKQELARLGGSPVRD